MADIIGDPGNNTLLGIEARGGNDLLFGANAGDTVFSFDDALFLSGAARGGNDDLFGGDADDRLTGDAGEEMVGNSRGGDDRLIA